METKAEKKLLHKVKDQPPVNAELTLRRKMNSTKGATGSKQKKKKESKDKKKTKAKDAVPTNEQKQKKKRKQEHSDDEKEDEKEEARGEENGEEEEEEEEEASQQEESQGQQKKPKKADASNSVKKGNIFSLSHAQKLSKTKKGQALNMKRPAAGGKSTGKTGVKAEEKNQEKKESVPAAANTPPPKRIRQKQGQELPNDQKKQEHQQEERRSKRRNRITSQAYHSTYDLWKPKVRDGLDCKTWEAKVAIAKEKAREAHAKAGEEFDKENPKEDKKQQKSDPPEEEKKPKDDKKKKTSKEDLEGAADVGETKNGRFPGMLTRTPSSTVHTGLPVFYPVEKRGF